MRSWVSKNDSEALSVLDKQVFDEFVNSARTPNALGVETVNLELMAKNWRGLNTIDKDALATALGTNGTVVVGRISGNGHSYAVIWHKDGSYTNIHPANASFSLAEDIADDGTIVGSANDKAYVWFNNQRSQYLPGIGDNYNSWAYGTSREDVISVRTQINF
jgi:uncharacterized membrane protein